MRMTKFLIMPALFISLGAFLLCIIVTVSLFFGFTDIFATATVVLFIGVFPLFIGVVLLLVKRLKSQELTNWMAFLFFGIPQWFITAYRIYFILIWIGGFGALIQEFRDKPSWMALLFVLIPSVFYLTCVGGYWSIIRELSDNGQSTANEDNDVMGFKGKISDNTKRIRIVLFVIFAHLVVLIVLGIMHFGNPIEENLKNNNYKEINLGEAVPGKWYKVYIFPPYSTKEDISETLGFKWHEIDFTNIFNDDSISLLVFIKGREVYDWYEHKRKYGDFSSLFRKKGYLKKEAVFKIIDQKTRELEWKKRN